VWDFSSHLNSLVESDAPTNRDGTIHKQTPILKFGGHKDEGYAIDWSPVVPGRLVSGILYTSFCYSRNSFIFVLFYSHFVISSLSI
jgi:hypothetical protein